MIVLINDDINACYQLTYINLDYHRPYHMDTENCSELKSSQTIYIDHWQSRLCSGVRNCLSHLKNSFETETELF